VLRHAKTLTDPPPGGRDHDRVLNQRGRRDAAALGRRLGDGGDRMGFRPGQLPGLVLCSTAARTRQTAELALAGLDPGPAVDFRDALYRADPDDILGELATVDDEVASCMVVGHNPTMHQLIAALPGAGATKARRTIEVKGVPTCTLAVYRLPVARWSGAALGTARLLGYFTPPY
jgi:phosphohistidine phosphatase